MQTTNDPGPQTAPGQPARTVSDSIQEKLGIKRDELNSLYTACPVNGAVGTAVAMEIRRRFGLDDNEEDWVTRLYERGLLTEAEWRWLRDG